MLWSLTELGLKVITIALKLRRLYVIPALAAITIFRPFPVPALSRTLIAQGLGELRKIRVYDYKAPQFSGRKLSLFGSGYAGLGSSTANGGEGRRLRT